MNNDTTATAVAPRTITEADDTAEERDFRLRARRWIAASLPPLDLGGTKRPLQWDDEVVARDRRLQRALFDAGLAGITVPREDGGQGRPPRFQQIFSEEAAGYRMPEAMGVAFNVVLPTMLAHASPEVRQRFIPPMLRGEEIWCQFLSEPSGGSDLAGLLTKATRDGDTWVINGQKVWTTGANHSDYAVCLARTDPDVPKHAGLTMFAVPVRGHGVTVVPLQLLDGSVDFCQEYLDDVVIPAEHTIGAVNDGWRVATTLMTNERAAVGRGWMLSNARRPTRATSTPGIQLSQELVQLATAQGRMQDRDVRALIGESWVIAAVQAQTVQRVADAMRAGKLPGHAAAIPKLLSGVAAMLQGDLAVAVAGAAAAAWPITDESGSQAGMARVASHGIGGGTNEMQRNAIAERLLGLPREPSTDRQVPFNQLRQNTIPVSSAEASKS